MYAALDSCEATARSLASQGMADPMGGGRRKRLGRATRTAPRWRVHAGLYGLGPYRGQMRVDRRRVRAAKRRKSRLAKGVQDLTDAQWAALRTLWGGCAYCGATGTPLQRDCVLPVARGGRYTVGNVVPACPSCNSSKWHSEVTSWMRRRGLDEAAFLARHLVICTGLERDVPVGNR